MFQTTNQLGTCWYGIIFYTQLHVWNIDLHLAHQISARCFRSFHPRQKHTTEKRARLSPSKFPSAAGAAKDPFKKMVVDDGGDDLVAEVPQDRWKMGENRWKFGENQWTMGENPWKMGEENGRAHWYSRPVTRCILTIATKSRLVDVWAAEANQQVRTPIHPTNIRHPEETMV